MTANNPTVRDGVSGRASQGRTHTTRLPSIRQLETSTNKPPSQRPCLQLHPSPSPKPKHQPKTQAPALNPSASLCWLISMPLGQPSPKLHCAPPPSTRQTTHTYTHTTPCYQKCKLAHQRSSNNTCQPKLQHTKTSCQNPIQAWLLFCCMVPNLLNVCSTEQ